MPDLTPAESGWLNARLERGINTASPALTDWLYGEPPRGWGFKPRYIKEGTRNTTRFARDIGALLSIYREHPKDRRVELCLRLSSLLTQQKLLQYALDRDGRLRTSIKLLGTKTARMVSHESAMGTGYNLHVTPDSHKHLIIADPGHDLVNCDLSGADGWTVGAECAALGDPTLLEDLRAGLKLAQALALLYEHGEVLNRKPRAELVALAGAIDKNDWLYQAAKIGGWAFCYGAGPLKIAETITEESWKATGTPLYIEVSVVRRLQALLFGRYPGIPRRQRRIDMLLSTTGCIASYNGHTRVFFGRRDDPATQRDAYAETPQVMTTWATKLAWMRLWRDPENVRADGSRIIRPLLLVHDSLVCQSPADRREWTVERLRAAFDNELVIAGIRLRIPAAGALGPTWAHACDTPACPATLRFSL